MDRSDADAPESLVTEAMVDHLARLADLPLTAGRRAAVTAQLDALLTDARAVNRFMAGRRTTGPAVRFVHRMRGGGTA